MNMNTSKGVEHLGMINSARAVNKGIKILLLANFKG